MSPSQLANDREGGLLLLFLFTFRGCSSRNSFVLRESGDQELPSNHSDEGIQLVWCAGFKAVVPNDRY